MKNRNRTQGFTLIEVIIVIAILAIVAGAMAPLAARMIDSTRMDTTQKRQQLIFHAIMGDPAAPGAGFLSDIGRVPGPSLVELATSASLPLYTLDPCGVGAGWRGPYILEGVDSSGKPLDGWGKPMDFMNGQIRSGGQDQNLNTAADNIVYPSTPITMNNITSGLNLNVLALSTNTSPPMFVHAGGQIIVYFAQDGVMQTQTVVSGSGVYTYPSTGFPALPQGIHAIAVRADPDGPGPLPVVTNTITAYCPGGSTVYQTVALR